MRNSLYLVNVFLVLGTPFSSSLQGNLPTENNHASRTSVTTRHPKVHKLNLPKPDIAPSSLPKPPENSNRETAVASTAQFLCKKFQPESEKVACEILDEVYKIYTSMENANKTLLMFIDIDETLIKEASDTNSYKHCFNFSQMRAVNLDLAQKLRDLNSQKKNLKFIGLTNVSSLKLEITPEGYPNIVPVDENGKSMIETRCDAMEYLKIPLNTSFWSGMKELPFIVESDDIGGEPLFKKDGEEPSKVQVQDGQYYLETSPGKYDKKICAFSVYNRGMIFLKQCEDNVPVPLKGIAMHAFLSSVFGNEPKSWPPMVIVGIDDHSEMIDAMEKECVSLKLPFYGIHYDYKINL
ncbi:MAG: DUF2608 domain-containing protein [Puniceicoccales bacterium]|jgi:hypothetical protein|nr:DUF2608 domain-containing protein [Puniceicoccales bacterium]